MFYLICDNRDMVNAVIAESANIVGITAAFTDFEAGLMLHAKDFVSLPLKHDDILYGRKMTYKDDNDQHFSINVYYTDKDERFWPFIM